MARLWSCGFELNSAVSGVEFTANSTNSIVTTPVRSGTYAYRCNTNTSSRYDFQAASAQGPFYFRTYFRVDTLPSTTVGITRIASATSAMVCDLRMTTTGTIQVVDTVGTIGTSAALSTGTWYRLELMIDLTGAGATDIVTFRIDGVTSVTSSTRTISVNMGQWFFGNTTGAASGILCYYDDMAINDNTGSVQNSWPGEGKIIHLRPNAAGDNNTWPKSTLSAGDANNYQDMDEVTPDDASTRLRRTTTTVKVDDYNVDDPSSLNSYDNITLVHVGIRGGSLSGTASTDRDVLLRIKSASAGTMTKSANSTNRLNTAGTYVTNTSVANKNYQLTAYTDPTTGSAWTVTGTNSLTNMQIGVENQTSVTTEVIVSTIWALVEYTVGTPPPANSSNFLMYQ